MDSVNNYSPLYMGLMLTLCLCMLGMIIFLLYHYVTRGVTHNKAEKPIYTRALGPRE